MSNYNIKLQTRFSNTGFVPNAQWFPVAHDCGLVLLFVLVPHGVLHIYMSTNRTCYHRPAMSRSPTSPSFRGAYNPRSRGRGGYAPRGRARASEPEPDNTVFLQGLKQPPSQSIPIPPFAGSDANLVISGSQCLGSYSWTNRPTPTIIVPGSPAQWLDRQTVRVNPDTGTNIIDHNGHHLGEAPMVPIFAAVDANEDADTFDWSEVDIVTDRNALRHLFRWASGNTSKNFRIDLQLVGKKTLLLSRWEKQTSDEYPGYTYGSNYFSRATKKPNAEAVAHHRIVNYDWNGLNMVVRSTVDAFLPSDNDSKSEEDLDDVINAISSLNVARDKKEQVTDVEGTALKVIHSGELVPQESIVEVATISIYRESQLNWDEKGPQLYLSQIPHFYVGLHERGSFTEVRKHKFDYTTLQSDIKENLKKLRQALASIQRIIVKNGQRGRLSLVCIDGKLEVYERVDDKSFLPDEFLERFGF